MSETSTETEFVAYCTHCGRGVNPGDFLCCPLPNPEPKDAVRGIERASS